MANAARKRTRWGHSDDALTLRKMEGLLQSLRGQPANLRPEQVTHVYLAGQFGVSAATMRQRLADAETRRGRDDSADHFADLWQQIGNVLCDRTAAAIFQTAHDPGNRNCVAAAKWILERSDPDTYGTGERARATPAHEASSVVADVPQEVWDEMTPGENETLEQIEAMVTSEMVKLEALVRRVQQRVANRRVRESRQDDE